MAPPLFAKKNAIPKFLIIFLVLFKTPMLIQIQANILASIRMNPCSVDKGNFMSETNKVTTSLLYTFTDNFQ